MKRIFGTCCLLLFFTPIWSVSAIQVQARPLHDRVVSGLNADTAKIPPETAPPKQPPSALQQCSGVFLPFAGLSLALAITTTILLFIFFKRKRIETALAKERNRYKLYTNASPFGIIGINNTQEIVLVNPAAERLLECESEAVVGQPFDSLPLSAIILDNIQRKMQQQSSSQMEFRLMRPSGIPVVLSLRTQCEPEGGCLLFLMDITRRVEAGTLILKILKEKDILVKEIHHRVKNNMQIITSLLGMQEEADTTGALFLQETRSRIKTIALVHEKLIGEQDRFHINLQTLAHDIVYRLFWTHPGLSKRVNIVMEIPPLYGSLEVAIPLALILNELAESAMTRAFPEPQKGRLGVSLRQEGEGFCLEVQGTGPDCCDGIDEGSIGFKIVRILSSQLKGKIALPPGEDYLVRITLPPLGILGEEGYRIAQNEAHAREGEVELFMGKEG